jgi:histone H3/H4
MRTLHHPNINLKTKIHFLRKCLRVSNMVFKKNTFEKILLLYNMSSKKFAGEVARTKRQGERAELALPAISRGLRSGGIKRVSHDALEMAANLLADFLEHLGKHSSSIARAAKKKTIKMAQLKAALDHEPACLGLSHASLTKVSTGRKRGLASAQVRRVFEGHGNMALRISSAVEDALVALSHHYLQRLGESANHIAMNGRRATVLSRDVQLAHREMTM